MNSKHCKQCASPVPPAEAALSQRSCGAVLCSACRRKRYQPFRSIPRVTPPAERIER